MPLTRRDFLQGTLVGGAALATGLPVVGCAPVRPAPQVNALVGDDGLIVVPVASHPDLARVGGAVTLALTAPATASGFAVPKGGVLLIHRAAFDDPPEYIAVESACPHLGCPLGWSEDDHRIKCPCHPSEFLAKEDSARAGSCTGTVVHAPAKRDLFAWPARYNATTQSVTIDLKENLCAPPATDGCPAVVAGTLTFDLTKIPELSAVGGTKVCTPAGLFDQNAMGQVLLRRVDAQTVTALSTVCTHSQCWVVPQSTELVCPCHDARFTLEGKLTQPNNQGAPQGDQLTKYETTLTGDTLVVKVG